MTTWAVDPLNAASEVAPQAHRVYLALLSFGTPKGAGVYSSIRPSIETLAERAGLPTRTVHRVLQVLRQFGLVCWERGRQGRANRYRTLPPNVALPLALEQQKGLVLRQADRVAATVPLADARGERAFAKLRGLVRSLLRLGQGAATRASDGQLHAAEAATGGGLNVPQVAAHTAMGGGLNMPPVAYYQDSGTKTHLPRLSRSRSDGTQGDDVPPSEVAAAAAASVAAQDGEGKPDRTGPERQLSGEEANEAIAEFKSRLAERNIGEPKRTELAEWMAGMGLEPDTFDVELAHNSRIRGALGVHIIESEAPEWLERQRKVDRDLAEWDAREAERRRQAAREAVAKALDCPRVADTMRDVIEPAGAAELVEELAAMQPIGRAALTGLLSKAIAKATGQEPDASELAALVEEFEPAARSRKALAKVNKHIHPTAEDPEPTAEELPIVSMIADLLRFAEQQVAEQRVQAVPSPFAVALPQAPSQPEAMAELLPGDLVQRIGELPPEEQAVFNRVVGPKIQATRAAKRRAKARHVGRAVGGDASTTFEDAIDGGGASTAFEATIDGGSAATFEAVAA